MSKEKRKKLFKNNWQYKSLEVLENEYWGEPEYPSRLVTEIHRLRHVPLNEWTTENFRLYVGQQFSLDILMPLVIELLQKDLLIEGDLYEGDLLQNVLTVDPTFWQENPDYWERIKSLIESRLNELDTLQIKYQDFLQALN